MANPAGLSFLGVAFVGAFIAVIDSAYIVDEGNVAVITHLGQAVRQEVPSGLSWKVPFIQGVHEFDVRERALTGEFVATTSNQLSSTVKWSMNWRPDATKILDIYKLYGSPDEFASNIVLPRLNQALKAAIGQHSAIELSRERSQVAETMLMTARGDMEGLPLITNSVQLDDFTLPSRYWDAVLAREEQREVTERERLLLEQQDIQAQQEVQTAQASAQAQRLAADAQAYETSTLAQADAERIRLMADAEAEGIEVIQTAIAGNPLYIEYHKAQQWNGQLPSHMVPGGSVPFVNVGE